MGVSDLNDFLTFNECELEVSQFFNIMQKSGIKVPSAPSMKSVAKNLYRLSRTMNFLSCEVNSSISQTDEGLE